MKTSELIGPALDWAVEKALNPKIMTNRGWRCHFYDDYGRQERKPSTNWSQGGPIIEREGIYLRAVRKDGHPLNGTWMASPSDFNTGTMVQWVKREDWHNHYFSGPTPLIAAMRCYVASKLGDTIEIPKELT